MRVNTKETGYRESLLVNAICFQRLLFVLGEECGDS